MPSVSFSGHRKIVINQKIEGRLVSCLTELIEKEGVVDFFAGGAVGWDTLCALNVIRLKNVYPQIHLNLILPCCEREQTAKWNKEQKEAYRQICSAADDVSFISEKYSAECMRLRNAQLVRSCDILVCFYNEKNPASGTGQTVRMAEKRNVRIYNLFYDLDGIALFVRCCMNTK